MSAPTAPRVYIVDAVRTPVGRYRGGLSSVRPDDLAARTITALLGRVPAAREAVDEVVFGATNQAGEDNRNVARMALLLAGLPYEVTGVTVNRLCGSGLEAIQYAYRAIAMGERSVMIAGGVESMTRAPFVMAKAAEAFDRTVPAMFDTSLGWRFTNPKMAERFPLESMGDTAENVAALRSISREAQDRFALTSHQRAARAVAEGAFADELVPVEIAQRKGPAVIVSADESVRADASVEQLAKLAPVFRKGGSVTAGNSSPINDGASGVLVASEEFVRKHGLTPLGRVRANAVAGVEPGLMGLGPIPAMTRALARAGISADALDTVELNEAFAAQALACIDSLGLDPARVNPDGGAIALGHPIGSSGARIATTLLHRMRRQGLKLGAASLCIGVGQGIATIFERD
ncbi:MAG: acetyl-CoA C-acyltransferase [Deltaproteobacteria bacterium]|nr:acetyl-CoA C-acyltransferase [Deltaproteobacteria bacterium]